MSCGCRCHVNRGAGCDQEHDTGSSGVPGAWSCSPCDGITDCERCGARNDQPHAFVEGDCVMPHNDHRPAKHGRICGRHFHHINDTLTQIEELYALRDDVLLPGPGGGERHGTRIGSPAPGRIEVMALDDKRNRDWHDDAEAVPDVPGTLYGWIRLMAEERDDPKLGRVNGNLSTLIGVLKREKNWLAAFAGVDDYIADLDALHRHVATAIGDTRWPSPIGRCPNDQSKLFYDARGVDVVTCRRCKASWAGVHLDRLRLIFEREQAEKQERKKGQTT